MSTLLLSAIVATVFTQSQSIYVRHWQLRRTEHAAMETFASFIQSNEHFIPEIESRLSTLLHARGPQAGGEAHLTDSPLVRLVKMRRLAKEWPSLLVMVKEKTGLPFKVPWLENVRWPTETQIENAARMFMRAQITYDFSTDLLAKGNILTNVTADDCFHVAKMFIKYDYYGESLEWLRQALIKINTGDNTLLRREVLRYLVSYACATGNVNYLKSLYIELSNEYSWPILPSQELTRMQSDVVVDGCEQVAADIRDIKDIEMFHKYGRKHIEKHSRLCRGEVKTDSRLVCRYVHYQKPHLRFQPFKLEELQLDPPVVRFHEVVTDLEAEALIKSVLKSMKVATVVGQVTVDVRTSESGWVYPGQSPVHDAVARRMADLTRLNSLTAEANQMSRYGPSGEYFTHLDARSDPTIQFKEQRVATLMFYLNDVMFGGNTVFFTWNLSVTPIKNSAVFWFNLLRNGDVDRTSDHSGCPVLNGQKWVMNKWFRNEGNEFSTSCGLNIDDSFKRFFHS